jgi:23S rRNA (adenine-N6)-dimethyltransferase
VASAGVQRGDLVLDIGAGSGAITQPLLRAGARVIAVELHQGRARQLGERFAGESLKVVRVDATDLRLPGRPFRVVANPPFGVSTALLKRLLAPGSRMVSADLVLPLHVARRWASGHGPGQGRWSRTFDVDIAIRLPRAAFCPPPPMDVAVLRVRRRSTAR